MVEPMVLRVSPVRLHDPDLADHLIAACATVAEMDARAEGPGPQPRSPSFPP